MNDGDDAFDRARHYFYLGLQHIESSNYLEAEVELRRSLQYVPDRPSTLANLSAALLRQKKYDQAEAVIELLRSKAPGYPECLVNEGFLHCVRREYVSALACFDKAIAGRADYAEAHKNRGAVLATLYQFEAALKSLDRAVELDPKSVDALCFRGDVQVALKQLDAGVDSYERAARLDPGFEYLQGVLLHARMRICDWRDHAAGLASLAARIEKGERASSGFSVLSLFPSPQLQRRSAEIVVADRYPPDPSLGPIPRPTAARRKLRVAYYSADFYAHATSNLIAGLLEAHDRSRIEVLGFSFGPDHQDEMRLRISSACDRFVDVREASDAEVARMSRDSGVDIAVDLKGLTQDSRPGIFALRAAPLQVSYLGFPGTMGADYIDYLIADRIVVPEHNQRYYSEKLVYLPDCYQVNDARRAVSERHFTRAELGLPESGFVFCCFNSNYKITPEMLDSWVRILQQVEGSVLWLLQDNSTAARNLRREARLRGLDERRLVFAHKLPIAEHLARQKVANLFLDTSPCNAHTTASDALWAGLPLLTLEGPAFHGRVASSLLACIGLPELVTSTVPAYEATAIALARNPEALATLRSRLWRNRLQSPLFNTSLFARHIEDAFAQMYERHCQGLAPDTLYLDRPAAG